MGHAGLSGTQGGEHIWVVRQGLNVKSLVLLQQGIIVRRRGLRVRRINGGGAQKARAVRRTEVATRVSENGHGEMNGTLNAFH